MTPKISVLIYTARDDYPFVRTELHCFDPAVKTLATQTFQDFELVVVDMLYEKRPNWFRDNPQPFPVKHVPSSPNFWQSRRRTGLCAQINRGFTWADGELLWMGGENNMFPPTHLENVWKLYKKTGKIPVAWYAICGSEERGRHADCPADFNLLGYTQNHIQDMDHRAKRFVTDKKLQIDDCHHQNYFGYSSVPTETAVAINGFDELFDGQWGLFDCDFGSRLDLAGKKMVLSRDIFIVEPPVAPGPYSGIGHQQAFKCHYAIYLHNRASKRKVNTPLPANYAEQVKETSCRNICSLKERCAKGAAAAKAGPPLPEGTIGESAYYPFCEGVGGTAEMAAELFANPPVRSLVTDREDRRAGKAPFDRGTFHTP